MIWNQFKTAWRSIAGSWLYSVINILGLSVGLGCFIVVALYVQYESGYDRQFRDADRIYRFSRDFYSDGTSFGVELATSPGTYAEFLPADFPQIEKIGRLMPVPDSVIATQDGTLFREAGYAEADAAFIELFNFQWLAGDAGSALDEPYSIVLTSSAALKYFGTIDALGRTLLLDNQHPMEVTGVIEDLGDRTHFAFESLGSLQTSIALNGSGFIDNFQNRFHTYALLQEDTDVDTIREQSAAYFERHYQAGMSAFTGYAITPLTDIHLESTREQELRVPGSKALVDSFAVIAVFILLIACVNFMNLATVRSMQRSREIGLRKALGSSRGLLLFQFLTEAVGMALLAMLVGLVLVELSLPAISGLLGKTLELQLVEVPAIWAALLLLALLTGLVSGSYPALYLSGLKAATTLKGDKTEVGGVLLRRTLVVLQFSIAITLLIALAVVYLQTRMARSTELGYNKDQVVVVSGTSKAGLGSQWETLKTEWLSHPGVRSVTASNVVPAGPNANAMGMRAEGGSEEGGAVPFTWVDFDFFETYAVDLLAGRTFDPQLGGERLGTVLADGTLTASFVINDMAARQFGWSADTAIGKWIEITQIPLRGTVVGVVEDVNFESIRSPQKAMVYMMPGVQGNTGRPPVLTEASILVAGADMDATLAHLDSTWTTLVPDQPVTRRFLDQDFERLYASEEMQGNFFALFSVLALVIACMGLYGLAAYNAERRTKEIGVRKVLGGSVWSIVLLLTNDFSKLVLMANVIAWPVAYFAMERWLENFAYRIDLTPLIFIGSGLIALCIAWVTVGGTAAKAAAQKPVLALRYE